MKMNNSIRVYSTETCLYCKAVKNYLTEKGVHFSEYDVLDDQNARNDMIRISGQMGVPVIIIDDEIIIGFDREKLEEKFTSK